MSKSTALNDYLYQIAARAKAEGRKDVCRWILANMKREEKAAKPQRGRKAHAVNPVTGRMIRGRSGEVWISPELLRKAEEEDKDVWHDS